MYEISKEIQEFFFYSFLSSSFSSSPSMLTAITRNNKSDSIEILLYVFWYFLGVLIQHSLESTALGTPVWFPEHLNCFTYRLSRMSRPSFPDSVINCSLSLSLHKIKFPSSPLSCYKRNDSVFKKVGFVLNLNIRSSVSKHKFWQFFVILNSFLYKNSLGWP